MSFFSEAAIRAGLNELSLAGGYNVINYNGLCVYVEGIKQLILVSESEIVLLLKGARLTIRGEQLKISELSDAMVVKGSVLAMEFDPTEKSKKSGGDK